MLLTAFICVTIPATLGGGRLILHDPVPMSLVAVAGTIDSIAWALSFLPPERYLAHVRARAQRRHTD